MRGIVGGVREGGEPGWRWHTKKRGRDTGGAAGWPQAARGKGCEGEQRQRRAGKRDARAHIETLLAPMAPGSALVTILDGHPAAHDWLGGVRGQRVVSHGPDHFGQSGDIPDLYREYGLDTDAVLDACAQALLSL